MRGMQEDLGKFMHMAFAFGSQFEIADLNYKLEREKAARVEAEARAKEAQTLKDVFLSQPQEDQIPVLLGYCSSNWQEMIESGDLTVLKTLETYNAIHRIPSSIINHSFSMTIDDEEIEDTSALYMAAEEGNVEMTRLLLLHPAIDVNAADSTYGWPPLSCACEDVHVEVVRLLLLDRRVDVNKTND
eukprot:scaffold8399_cov179-Ochromonas_danica.AAC.1